jgi:protein-disulfide isomerase
MPDDLPEDLVVDLDRHLYGAPDAPVRVVEYGDFQCPYCRAAAPVLRELVDTSRGRVAVVFRHFPLFTIHAFALTAALAAEASGDRFWQMHDLLFADQDHLTDHDLAAYAAQLGVRDAVGEAAQVFRPAVEADYRAGVAGGVRGTPTLFIGGERYAGRVQLAALRAAVSTAV